MPDPVIVSLLPGAAVPMPTLPLSFMYTSGAVPPSVINPMPLAVVPVP